VHEELLALGAQLSYPALTSFCRRCGIQRTEKVPAGRYSFAPGEEMQHDTSLHRIQIGGHERRATTAALVLCYSRMLYFQHYPRFTRFECKLFLTKALQYFGGACRVCLIDNTHLVVLSGTGSRMVPVPEMAALAERYGFVFKAHEKGDANRSGRVERPFAYIENNFLAGRDFQDWEDANRQAGAWCDTVNASVKRHLRASPRELYAAEQPQLVAPPAWVSEVYALHHRIVDVEGCVTVHTNRYSAPAQLIGRRVEVRETENRIEVYCGPRRVACHPRLLEACGQRVLLPEHRPAREQNHRTQPPAEEKTLLELAPELAEYVAALKQHAGGRGTPALRRLLQIVRDYPRQSVLPAVSSAAHYRLYDLERLERMVLRQIAGDYFLLPDPDGSDNDRGD
jgi:hypothetical protein